MDTPAPTLDLSGLSPEAVAAVTAVVEQLRAVPTPPPATPGHRRPGETHEEWVARFDAWVDSHTAGNPNMDDSRESIYD